MVRKTPADLLSLPLELIDSVWVRNLERTLRKVLTTKPSATLYSERKTCRRDLIKSVLEALQASNIYLQAILIFGIHQSLWQPPHRLTANILHYLARLPSIQHIATLDIQLNLHTDNAPTAFLALTQVLIHALNLRRLGLRPGLALEQTFRTGTANWEPLLAMLGALAPFRLHALCLYGVITSGAITVDRIVDFHTLTLRRFVIAYTNFRLPNSVRALFLALADGRVIEYVAFKDFWLHGSCWLAGAVLSEFRRRDQCLTWGDENGEGKDEAYRDWVVIEWNRSSHEEWMEWNNEDGRMGEGWMRRGMLAVVDLVDCGALRDL
ncbi:hypothetical protein IQ07DRAFT_663237 [Pyrenochaeta sp. DS3sAY3a]|nr:hypothetical protein IQ07DRAFT_663237 [Pyrenochaeta sp. DS3sAY3a]